MQPRVLISALIAIMCCTPLFAQSGKKVSETSWIDITAPLDPKTTPTYPGDDGIKIAFLHSMSSGENFTLSTLNMGAHSGTHVDAPMHFIKDGIALDKVSLERFIGPVRIIDCSPEALAIDAAELNKHDWKGAERIFFRTRNSRSHWMTDPTFHKDFTYIAPDAAQLMADAGVQLVGIDYISAEKFAAPEPKTHWILLGKSIPIIEGVYLDDVTAGDYDLMLLPLRIVGHEASPVRALIRPAQKH
jgi:arylformamidase